MFVRPLDTRVTVCCIGIIGVSFVLGAVWKIMEFPMLTMIYWPVAIGLVQPAELVLFRFKLWPAIFILGSGGGMNGAVMMSNDGYMPGRSVDASRGLLRTVEDSDGRLLFFGDNYLGYSLGDGLIVAGLLVALAIMAVTAALAKKMNDGIDRGWL